MRDILALHNALRDAGLDISGVSDPGPNAYINGWNTTPTEAERAQAGAILKAFDWTEKPALTLATIEALSSDEKSRLIDLLLTQAAGVRPDLLDMAKKPKA